MKTATLMICTFCCLNPTMPAASAGDDQTHYGWKRGHHELRLVDEGADGKGWDQAAKSFQCRMGKAEWVVGTKEFRARYGRCGPSTSRARYSH